MSEPKLTDKDLIAEAVRRDDFDLPHMRCKAAPLREKCAVCLAYDLAQRLKIMPKDYI